ncbi:MAG: hypothetical protein WD749_11365 [Phycisphaerales bacterium]
MKAVKAAKAAKAAKAPESMHDGLVELKPRARGLLAASLRRIRRILLNATPDCCRQVGEWTDYACLYNGAKWTMHTRKVMILWCCDCDPSGSCTPCGDSLAGTTLMGLNGSRRPSGAGAPGPARRGSPLPRTAPTMSLKGQPPPNCVEVIEYGRWKDTKQACTGPLPGSVTGLDEYIPAGPLPAALRGPAPRGARARGRS